MKFRFLVPCLVPLMFLACGGNLPSKDEIEKQFEARVSTAKSCTEDQDCVIVQPGCPLGCATAVNIEHRDDVERLAARLIGDYESSHGGCTYRCAGVQARCLNANCEVEQR